MRNTTLKHLGYLGSVLLLLCLATSARADTIVPTLTANAGTLFTYKANFTTATSGGFAVERLQAGNFFTIYDIQGLTACGTIAGWTCSIQANGVTATDTAPTDTALLNVTWTYTGATITVDTEFTGFTITTGPGFTGVDELGRYTSETTKNMNPQEGTDIGHIGFVSKPTTTVPEPASMLLLGTGLAGIAGIARRKLKTRKLK